MSYEKDLAAFGTAANVSPFNPLWFGGNKINLFPYFCFLIFDF